LGGEEFIDDLDIPAAASQVNQHVQLCFEMDE
jgi:hypothetical protein